MKTIEIEYTLTEMKNAFNGLISRLYTNEESGNSKTQVNRNYQTKMQTEGGVGGGGDYHSRQNYKTVKNKTKQRNGCQTLRGRGRDN